MGPRIIAICALFGLIWVVPYFLLRPGRQLHRRDL